MDTDNSNDPKITEEDTNRPQPLNENENTEETNADSIAVDDAEASNEHTHSNTTEGKDLFSSSNDVPSDSDTITNDDVQGGRNRERGLSETSSEDTITTEQRDLFSNTYYDMYTNSGAIDNNVREPRRGRGRALSLISRDSRWSPTERGGLFRNTNDGSSNSDTIENDVRQPRCGRGRALTVISREDSRWNATERGDYLFRNTNNMSSNGARISNSQTQNNRGRGRRRSETLREITPFDTARRIDFSLNTNYSSSNSAMIANDNVQIRRGRVRGLSVASRENTPWNTTRPMNVLFNDDADVPSNSTRTLNEIVRRNHNGSESELSDTSSEDTRSNTSKRRDLFSNRNEVSSNCDTIANDGMQSRRGRGRPLFAIRREDYRTDTTERRNLFSNTNEVSSDSDTIANDGMQSRRGRGRPLSELRREDYRTDTTERRDLHLNTNDVSSNSATTTNDRMQTRRGDGWTPSEIGRGNSRSNTNEESSSSATIGNDGRQTRSDRGWGPLLLSPNSPFATSEQREGNGDIFCRDSMNSGNSTASSPSLSSSSNEPVHNPGIRHSSSFNNRFDRYPTSEWSRNFHLNRPFSSPSVSNIQEMSRLNNIVMSRTPIDHGWGSVDQSRSQTSMRGGRRDVTRPPRRNEHEMNPRNCSGSYGRCECPRHISIERDQTEDGGGPHGHSRNSQDTFGYSGYRYNRGLSNSRQTARDYFDISPDRDSRLMSEIENRVSRSARGFSDWGSPPRDQSNRTDNFDWPLQGRGHERTAPNRGNVTHRENIRAMELFTRAVNDSGNYVTGGYPNRALNTLGWVIISEEKLSLGQECTVCLQPFMPNERITELVCGHFFHFDCIGKWLRVRRTCPICRRVVRKRRPPVLTPHGVHSAH